MEAIKAGDVVRLKSGGPLMTVHSLNEGIVKTTWFNQNWQEISEHYFLLGQLEPAETGAR